MTSKPIDRSAANLSRSLLMVQVMASMALHLPFISNAHAQVKTQQGTERYGVPTVPLKLIARCSVANRISAEERARLFLEAPASRDDLTLLLAGILVDPNCEENDRTDRSLAITFYRESAALGNTTAVQLLVDVYFMRDEDSEKAIDVLHVTCEAGNMESCTRLGGVYENGRVEGVSKNKTEALRLYRLACDRGDAVGCFLWNARK
jgi:exosome complex RNA-binding protein Rrp42 (RNase PH superfamily)